VKTKLGKAFLNTVSNCFKNDNPLHKIFNRNTVKISYSCMPSIRSYIDAHNKQLLSNHNLEQRTDQRTCNCRKKENCPLEGNCMVNGVIYQATVESDESTDMTYIGSTENNFKLRYANHLASFKHAKLKNSTELSKYVWYLKENEKNFKIKWKIIKKAKAYSNTGKTCNLCLMEKYYIIFEPRMSSLNRRTDLFSNCLHCKRYLLSRLT